MVANPASDVFGGRVKGQNVVKILMVEGCLYALLDLRKVAHHTVFVEFGSAAMHSNNPIMPMHLRAFALIVKLQAVTAGNFQAFCYIIHFYFFVLNCEDTANQAKKQIYGGESSGVFYCF